MSTKLSVTQQKLTILTLNSVEIKYIDIKFSRNQIY